MWCSSEALPVSQRLQDVDEVAVQLLAADDGPSAQQVGRGHHEAAVLPPAQAAVAADQRLERGDLAGVGIRQLLT